MCLMATKGGGESIAAGTRVSTRDWQESGSGLQHRDEPGKKREGEGEEGASALRLVSAISQPALSI